MRFYCRVYSYLSHHESSFIKSASFRICIVKSVTSSWLFKNFSRDALDALVSILIEDLLATQYTLCDFARVSFKDQFYHVSITSHGLLSRSDR